MWIEAGRDVLLTQHMIQVQGDCGETNIVARAMTWSFGPAVLLPFKLGALLVFTAGLGVLVRRNRPAAELLVSVGVLISACLATWWDWVVVSWVQQLVGFK